MKIFNEYHSKRVANWWFEWSMFTHHEKVLFSVELNIPTPKDKSLFLGLSIFATTIFFIEVAWIGPKKNVTEYLDNINFKG